MSGSQDCWIADDEETQFNTKVVIQELTRSRTIYMFSISLPIVIFFTDLAHSPQTKRLFFPFLLY
jgi:hypothetical protein